MPGAQSCVLYSPAMSPVAWERCRSAAYYGAVCLAAVVIVVVAMDLPAASLHVPFAYSRGDERFPEYGFDVTLYLTTIKGLIDNGWILTNQYLGAPETARFHDFPQFQLDGFQFAVMKIVSLVMRDAAATLNVYFLLTFVLTAAISAYAMRRLRFSRLTAFVFSILFAFTPYHFHKGVYHLSYSAYYFVPLVALVSIWIVRGDLNGAASTSSAGAMPREFMLACLFAVLMGSWNLYYSFFAGFLICLSIGIACSGSAGRERRVALWRSILVLLILIGTVAAISAPVVSSIARNGFNPSAVQREPFQAEWWGLRITQLVLPSPYHSWEWMRVPAANLRRTWQVVFGPGHPTLINTNESVALGLIGTIGFFILLCALLRRSRAAEWSLTDTMARLNIGLLLLSTIGGFGMLLAVLTTASIRSYYRASVYIAYFSLLAIASVVERLRARSRPVHAATCIALLLFGLLDQIDEHARPQYAQVRRAYESDGAYFRGIEEQLPKGSMVFQLPARAFPDDGPLYRMLPYEGFLPYLHTRKIHWSYGAMNGRPNAGWQRSTGLLLPRELVTQLSRHSFAGVLVDRYGYPDSGSQLIRELSVYTAPPAVSADGRFAFFSLRGHSL